MELNGIFRRRGARWGTLATILITVTAGCGGQSLTTQPSATPAPSSTGSTNSAPTIRSITVSADRIEAGDQVSLVASVSDAETSPDLLDYEWSASPAAGQFSGSGSRVVWQAPKGQRSPDVYTITLVVNERYRQDGVERVNTVSSSVPVHYNDSHTEAQTVTLTFLNDSASSDVAPAQVVRNFSNSCPGKQQQLASIESERATYEMLGGDFSIDITEFYNGRTVGDVIAPCAFKRKAIASGQTQTTSGTCMLTTVYENWRWMLCDSRVSDGTAAAAARR